MTSHLRHFSKLLGIAAVVSACVSCGDVVRSGKAPVLLVIDKLTASRGGTSTGTASGFLNSDVLTIVTSPAPCSATAPCPTVFNDSGSVTLRMVLKDIGTVANPTTPSTNNEVTINRYHVVFRRSDGRNKPGVDIPYPFDGAATGTIASGGTLTLGFELVRHVAKEEPPLVQLVDSPTIISTIADITFYGQDVVGNEISVMGSISVDFGNFGD